MNADMMEKYELAKEIASIYFDEDYEMYPFFVLANYGILSVFKDYKDIILKIAQKVDICIADLPTNEIMKRRGFNPDDFFGNEDGEIVDENISCCHGVSSSGNNYVWNGKEFINEKYSPFIYCTTINSSDTGLLMSFMHEFIHLVKGENNNTYLFENDDSLGFVIRCGISIFKSEYFPNIKDENNFFYYNSYEIFDEAINCSQTEEAGRAILELEGQIPDKSIRDFFDQLDKAELTRDDGYVEACSAFKGLWKNQVFHDLISDNIVEGYIDYIIEEFNKIVGEDAFDTFDELLFKVDELACLGKEDSDEMTYTKREVQKMIDIFNENTKDRETIKEIQKKINDFSN